MASAVLLLMPFIEMETRSAENESRGGAGEVAAGVSLALQYQNACCQAKS